MDLTIAYLSEEKLFVREQDGTVRLFQSKFVQDLLDRDERDRERNAWKENSAGWQATEMNAMMAAQMGLETGLGRRVAFTSVASDVEADRCLFAVHTNTVGGLFQLELPDDERRLVHQPNLHLQDLSRHPLPQGEGAIVCAVQSMSGAAHLALMNADGGRMREITEGDSLDQCPSWVPIPGKAIVYQSAGIARDTQGNIRAVSPYRIERLDLDRGELETLPEAEGYDLLMPRCDDRQTLYCIRRPYRALGHEEVPFLTRVKYTLLWPIGVLASLGAFLNVFSTMFRGKPLTPASGPKQKGADPKQMFLWGRRIAADQIISDTADREQITVPRDWELVRIDATGNSTTLALGVAAYDLLEDGSIVYTDGTKIIHRTKSGATQTLAKHGLIQRLAVIRSE